MAVLEEIKEVIRLEIATLQALLESVGPTWEAAVEMIFAAPRKVVLSGMGKSGHIATKIAATFSSTGTPAVFLHPSESLHGDLGIVEPGDVLLLFGKSGESDEMIAMLPSLKKMGCQIIAVTANAQSTMAKHADLVLFTPVEKEACALNLAPTCSTTAALVLGDALAVALMKKRGFASEDFALYHPAGRLGKRLLYQVKDLMRQGEENPAVLQTASFSELLKAIGEGGVNAVTVVDAQGQLKGLITGFDLRRAFEEQADLRQLTAQEIMNHSPMVTEPGKLAIECYQTMKNNPQPIMVLPVVDAGAAVGMITMQDMVRAGL
ncbi:MAG: KpsF/GutQ family sugar-phosphate isomerase [bacterium]|nr:KpsF/GutQ family sugar-phosphate isomerase [bacterium]